MFAYNLSAGKWKKYNSSIGTPVKYWHSITATDKFMYHFGGHNIEIGLAYDYCKKRRSII